MRFLRPEAPKLILAQRAVGKTQPKAADFIVKKQMLKQGSGLTAVFDPTHPAVSLTALNDLFNWPALNLMMHFINHQFSNTLKLIYKGCEL